MNFNGELFTLFLVSCFPDSSFYECLLEFPPALTFPRLTNGT
jgi:hypothetical protein